MTFVEECAYNGIFTMKHKSLVKLQHLPQGLTGTLPKDTFAF